MTGHVSLMPRPGECEKETGVKQKKKKRTKQPTTDLAKKKKKRFGGKC